MNLVHAGEYLYCGIDVITLHVHHNYKLSSAFRILSEVGVYFF